MSSWEARNTSPCQYGNAGRSSSAALRAAAPHCRRRPSASPPGRAVLSAGRDCYWAAAQIGYSIRTRRSPASTVSNNSPSGSEQHERRAPSSPAADHVFRVVDAPSPRGLSMPRGSGFPVRARDYGCDASGNRRSWAPRAAPHRDGEGGCPQPPGSADHRRRGVCAGGPHHARPQRSRAWPLRGPDDDGGHLRHPAHSPVAGTGRRSRARPARRSSRPGRHRRPRPPVVRGARHRGLRRSHRRPAPARRALRPDRDRCHLGRAGLRGLRDQPRPGQREREVGRRRRGTRGAAAISRLGGRRRPWLHERGRPDPRVARRCLADCGHSARSCSPPQVAGARRRVDVGPRLALAVSRHRAVERCAAALRPHRCPRGLHRDLGQRRRHLLDPRRPRRQPAVVPALTDHGDLPGDHDRACRGSRTAPGRDDAPVRAADGGGCASGRPARGSPRPDRSSGMRTPVSGNSSRFSCPALPPGRSSSCFATCC